MVKESVLPWLECHSRQAGSVSWATSLGRPLLPFVASTNNVSCSDQRLVCRRPITPFIFQNFGQFPHICQIQNISSVGVSRKPVPVSLSFKGYVSLHEIICLLSLIWQLLRIVWFQFSRNFDINLICILTFDSLPAKWKHRKHETGQYSPNYYEKVFTFVLPMTWSLIQIPSIIFVIFNVRWVLAGFRAKRNDWVN